MCKGIILSMTDNNHFCIAISDFESDWSSQRPDLDPKSVSIEMRLQMVARHFSDRASQALSEFDLEWWEYDFLSKLRRVGKPYECAVSELSDLLPLSSGAKTNRLNHLIDRKLVTRRHDEIDRRRVLVKLTRQGFKLVDSAATARFDAAEDVVNVLSKIERKQLNASLNKILCD